MAGKLDAKCKRCRRAGEKLFLKGSRCTSSKCAMVKRNYPPGIHGARGLKRLTDFGQQLKIKQKVRQTYGLREQQFKNLFKKASNSRGNTEEIFFILLEMRLDNVVYRLGLAKSRSQARQLVSHRYFEINGRSNNVSSTQLKVGDVLTVKENKKKKKLYEVIRAQIAKANIPSWLSYDQEKSEIKVASEPNIKETKQQIDFKPIIEFYSK